MMINRVAINVVLLLGLMLDMYSVNSAPAAEVTLKPAEMRFHEQGNFRDDGFFSFWDDGQLSDHFVATEKQITLTVVAAGHTVAGEPPRLAVEIAPVDGQLHPVAQLAITREKSQPYTVKVPIFPGYFTLRLRHLNRSVPDQPKQLRHLNVSSIHIDGATRATDSPTKWLLFHSDSSQNFLPSNSHTISFGNEYLHGSIAPETGEWTLASHEIGMERIRPVLVIDSSLITLAGGQASEQTQTHPLLGPCREITVRFQQPANLAATYHIAISKHRPEMLVQLDFQNLAKHSVTVNRAAPLVIDRLTLAGSTQEWNTLGDGKSNDKPCQLLSVADARQFECWWYLGLKHEKSGSSLLLGSLTNNKGLGRFFLDDNSNAVQATAWHDYEAIQMPSGAQIQGEPILIHFGRSGIDSLDRLGQLIAQANGIDLMRQHPIDPDDPRLVGMFNTWNAYGAGVIRGFHYQHNAAKYEKPFEDPAWTKANWKKIYELGLDAFGYVGFTPGQAIATKVPLVRRYGQPDFWSKGLKQITQQHPEYYIDGRIDFSRPAVVELERGRVAQTFQDHQDRLVSYNWDFTNFWSRLPGQYDPFQTSADTYRTAMGIWRKQALQHSAGAYGLVWMNVVGLNYDRCDVIHIGDDSDQAYYGRGFTVTEGLVRQISGRSFYNGQVWWNSADSFHVYAGGLYTFQQAKTHASFCSIAGNLIHLAEPFCDEEIPADRVEIIRRVAPTTADVSRAVDVFEHSPARLWNMKVQRPFGTWNIVGFFNMDADQQSTPITQEIRLADLGLSPDHDYLVYEFWSRSFLGTVRGSFTRTLSAPDCEIYAIVEKASHPQLISTSRHVRQMAVDIRDLKWDSATGTLQGISRVVGKDPYQLRIHVPADFTMVSTDVSGIDFHVQMKNSLLLVNFTSLQSGDVTWKVQFRHAH